MTQKAIFWDFDGTLVKANCSFQESLRKACQEDGILLQDAQLSYMLKSVCSWYHPEISYETRTGEFWWKNLLNQLHVLLTDSDIPVDKIPRILESFRNYAVSYSYGVDPQARKLLLHAKSLGFQNYLLSNNFPELENTVIRLGLRDCFQDVFLSSVIGYEKPQMELFQEAIKLAGNPGLKVMVGDNPDADIRGGKAAGMITVLVSGKAPCQEADYACQDLSDLFAILEKLKTDQN